MRLVEDVHSDTGFEAPAWLTRQDSRPRASFTRSATSTRSATRLPTRALGRRSHRSHQRRGASPAFLFVGRTYSCQAFCIVVVSSFGSGRVTSLARRREASLLPMVTQGLDAGARQGQSSSIPARLATDRFTAWYAACSPRPCVGVVSSDSRGHCCGRFG